MYIHSLSLRPSSIHVTVGPCSICPTTTATIFMCRGYQRAIAVQKLCKTRSVYVLPFLFCHATLTTVQSAGSCVWPHQPSRLGTSATGFDRQRAGQPTQTERHTSRLAVTGQY